MKHFPFPSSLQLLVTFIFLSVSISLTTLDVSYKRNYKITQYFYFCDWLGHLMRRADSFEKTLMLGKIEVRRRRGRQRMRWHHWLNRHGFEWTPEVGDGQGGLVCSSSWGCKESDTTEWLNWTELKNATILSFLMSFDKRIHSHKHTCNQHTQHFYHPTNVPCVCV